ncbi:hypothetical protein GWI33_010633 [Rhynchophorus ferrugineus]|nr:hypothetical protein GWI33_010633 [Rhynchophorus ferrugineus]
MQEPLLCLFKGLYELVFADYINTLCVHPPTLANNTTFAVPIKFYLMDNGTCDVIEEDHITRNVVFSSLVYTMYATIFVVALLGNVFVCYIVLQSPRMRTVTNYFIMNLAVGDILIALLCVPFTSVPLLLQEWLFGKFMCTVVCYVSALSVLVSAYTLVAISIDKYMLIMYPLKPRISKRSATWIIVVVWVFAGITVLPSGIFANLIQPEMENVTVNFYQKCNK